MDDDALRELLELERAREARRRRRVRVWAWVLPIVLVLGLGGWALYSKHQADQAERCEAGKAYAILVGKDMPDC